MASHANDSKCFIEKGPRARVIKAWRRFRHRIVAIAGRRCGEIGAYRRSCCVNATLTSPWKGLKYGLKKSARDARRSTFNNHAVPRLKKTIFSQPNGGDHGQIRFWLFAQAEPLRPMWRADQCSRVDREGTRPHPLSLALFVLR